MNKHGIKITELFMAKAGWDRCYYGTIDRTCDISGNSMVFGKIYVKNDTHCGFISSNAKDQHELGDKLDELVLMILDYGLHNNPCNSIKRYGFEYSLN